MFENFCWNIGNLIILGVGLACALAGFFVWVKKVMIESNTSKYIISFILASIAVGIFLLLYAVNTKC